MKRVIFRLSSLGDVILSQAVLEPPYAGETHWVVAKEFTSLLEGNPRIQKIWTYPRGGLKGWLSLLDSLSSEGFTEVLDVHSTLRTKIARLYFLLHSPKTAWKTISKERWRRIAYTTLKRHCPKSWRPTHLSERCARIAGGAGSERPNLRWLLQSAQAAHQAEKFRIAIVPSSAWPGKEWPTESYLHWIDLFRSKHPGLRIELFGTKKDQAALALRERLQASQIPFEDRIGVYSLVEVARALATMDFVIGSDTGLLHLAEAVGIPVITLFGPTRSDFGFGPSLQGSIPVDAPIGCSPCSKDGSLCYRSKKNRYLCLREVSPEAVAQAAERMTLSMRGSRRGDK
jgi:ADP-heptose:LPS heptosyltransferase